MNTCGCYLVFLKLAFVIAVAIGIGRAAVYTHWTIDAIASIGLFLTIPIISLIIYRAIFKKWTFEK